MLRWAIFLAVCMMHQLPTALGADDLAVTRNTNALKQPGLSMRVTANDPVIRGDPVALTVRLDNRNPQPVTIVIPQIRPPDQTTVLIYVKGPGESTFRPVKWPGVYDGALKSRVGPHRLPIVTIRAKHSLSFHLILDWDFNPANERERRWSFPEAGDYSVRITAFILDLPTTGPTVDASNALRHRVESDLSLVHIIEPAAKADVLAADDLLQLPNGWLLYGPSFTGNVLPDDLIDFRKRHAASRYFPFTELAAIHSDYWAAVVGNNRNAAIKACDRACETVERANQFVWPTGWKMKADHLLATLSRGVISTFVLPPEAGQR
jgi:hypothetical protein